MNKPENSIFIIFGGTGDLTKRKIIPALYQNYIQGLLPENFAIVGLGRTEFDDESYRNSFKDWIEDKSQLALFLQRISFKHLNVSSVKDFLSLKGYLGDLNNKINGNENYLFYLAVGPNLFEPIVKNLGDAKLCSKSSRKGWRRLIVEKPFGKDLTSAQKLNKTLLQYFDEEDIYRIDHYLGKETVQNILAFRFANGIFEPLWNRNFIDHIEITGAENNGVGTRGGYYDQSGHMRDMVQNHLLQILATIAMEPPNNFENKAVRDEKVKVFEALSPIDINNIEENVIRGQYAALDIEGNRINGYLQEDKVPSDSRTETFVAMKLFIENWRWSGVPFYIRTGKRMPSRVNEVVIHFKKTPHHLFTASKNVGHNKLILRIQPDEGIVMDFGMKKPGEGFQIKNVSMDFHYSDLTSRTLPDAYERLLLDVLNGDPTLYARNDAVEACWSFIDPVLREWQENDSIGIYSYPAGSWGPVEASRLFENKTSPGTIPVPVLANEVKTAMSDNIKVNKNPSELAENLVIDFVKFINGKDIVNIALAGGSTPKLFYETLAKYNFEIDWAKVHFYWGDERLVPPDHPDSNYLMTQKALLNHIDIPEMNIHRIYGENDPDDEVKRYKHEIQTNIPSLNFDWIFLGLGTDGHTASLFPNTENLKNFDDLCVVAEHPDTGQERISFTFPLLDKAKRITFLVTGNSKRNILDEILNKNVVTENYPASLLYKRRKDAEWWLDEDAYLTD